MGEGRVGVIISRDFRRERLEDLEILYNIRQARSARTSPLTSRGASYLGVVLEHVGILEWNNKQRGIQWRIIHPARNPDGLRKAIKAKMA
jgi:hypothetical protein